jgi:hypothetical protein
VRVAGTIDLFMPPRARFERGGGPSAAPYSILFGHRGGLFLVDPDGTNLRRVPSVPGIGLFNVAWSPDPARAQVLLFFRRPSFDAEGRAWQGVYLVDLGVAAKQGARVDDFALHLDDVLNDHTLWFSPRGTFVTWATWDKVCFRRIDEEGVVVLRAPPPRDGAELDIKGCTWSDDETKLAYTVGDELWIHDLARHDSYQVAELGSSPAMSEGETFLAEPRFVGGDVLVSRFTDLGPLLRRGGVVHEGPGPRPRGR